MVRILKLKCKPVLSFEFVLNNGDHGLELFCHGWLVPGFRGYSRMQGTEDARSTGDIYQGYQHVGQEQPGFRKGTLFFPKFS